MDLIVCVSGRALREEVMRLYKIGVSPHDIASRIKISRKGRDYDLSVSMVNRIIRTSYED